MCRSGSLPSRSRSRRIRRTRDTARSAMWKAVDRRAGRRCRPRWCSTADRCLRTRRTNPRCMPRRRCTSPNNTLVRAHRTWARKLFRCTRDHFRTASRRPCNRAARSRRTPRTSRPNTWRVALRNRCPSRSTRRRACRIRSSPSGRSRPSCRCRHSRPGAVHRTRGRRRCRCRWRCRSRRPRHRSRRPRWRRDARRRGRSHRSMSRDPRLHRCVRRPRPRRVRSGGNPGSRPRA